MQFTEHLPSNDRRDAHTDTDLWEGFMKYTVEMGSFHADWFMHSKVNTGGFKDTHTAWRLTFALETQAFNNTKRNHVCRTNTDISVK
jgi:hypothetical protein